MALGCNAIIGVDFDYITLEPETTNTKGEIKNLPYFFGVTANGNAVIIEKAGPRASPSHVDWTTAGSTCEQFIGRAKVDL